MEWILFTIGLLVGSILGMIIVGIVSSGKMSDLDSEIISLRIQRNLLKIHNYLNIKILLLKMNKTSLMN